MDLSVLPARQVLRWDLATRLLLALIVPLVVGALVSGGTAGLLSALGAAMVSISYLGGDMGIIRWSVFSAIGIIVAGVIGAALSTGDVWLQILFIFVLYTIFGAMLLAGITAQLAFTPIASLGLFAVVLFNRPLTVPVVLQLVVGVAWGLLLILVVPRWSKWPRLPIPPGGIKPDVKMLRRLVARPSWHDWAFPLLLGALAIAVLAVAAMVTQGSRPYWAVFALVTVLGPNRQQTVKDGWGTTAAALLGVAGALVLMQLPIPLMATILVSVAFGTVGALLLMRSKVLSKTALTVLVVVMVSVLAGNDPWLVGGERFIETVIGATGAVLAAGLAEFLAVRMEERQMESATAH